MHARSALFDVYGDHLAQRGHAAPVASLIRLLEPVGVAAPAVRTAISRMVAQGWLESAALPGGRGYRATDRAVRRLAETADRVYRRTEEAWDGRWHVALVALPRERTARQRLRADLGFLGYGRLDDSVWISPWTRPDLADAVRRAGGDLRTAIATDFDPPETPLAAWDLAALAAAYDAWLDTAAQEVAAHLARHADPDEAAFAARFHLVHEWRKFLFTDPGLPARLLPVDWTGHRAADFFAAEATRLEAGADRFARDCLDGAADSGP